MGRGRATLFDMPVTSNSYVNRKLKYICRRVVIGKPISFHLARHTYATLLLYDGVNITTIQKLLGHKNVRTTEIYSKVMDITVLKDLENANKLRGNRWMMKIDMEQKNLILGRFFISFSHKWELWNKKIAYRGTFYCYFL